MSYTRKKTITLDGAEFCIAPLTIEQVETLVAPVDELQQGKSVLASVYDLVCSGLNNAQAQPNDTPWTPARIKKELDQVTLGVLQQEILAFSGLAAKPAGESGAAAPTAAG